MKLTTEQLKQMIKEELENLNEYPGAYDDWDRLQRYQAERPVAWSKAADKYHANKEKSAPTPEPSPIDNSAADKRKAMKMIDMLFMAGKDANEIIQMVSDKYPNVDKVGNMVHATMMRS